MLQSTRCFILASALIILAVLLACSVPAIVKGSVVLITLVLGCVLGCATASRQSKRCHVGQPTTMPVRYLPSAKVTRKCEAGTGRTVVSHNVDLAIDEVVQYILRDFVLNWYDRLAEDRDRMKQITRDAMWCMVERLTSRFRAIDMVSLVSDGLLTSLTNHFKQIRLADTSRRYSTNGGIDAGRFSLHAFQSSTGRHHQMAMDIVNVILCYTLPKEYVNSDVVRKLLVQVLTSTVWLPLVSWLCDPDTINTRIHAWLTMREQLAVTHQRTYSYAANYEQFVDMIDMCVDRHHLTQIRYHIISEIMQATTIQNVKRAKGIDTDVESSPRGTTKGHLLKARNLKRYMNQLTVAKCICEKRLSMLGDGEPITTAGHHIRGKMVMFFSLIMSTNEARVYFMKYLRKTHEDCLLRFWMSVEAMKQSHKRDWHEMAVDIFQSYMAPPNSNVRQVLSRSTVKSMQAFMLGNEDVVSFWDAQQQVYQTLEEHHYPSFIVSDSYHSYISQIDSSGNASHETDPTVPSPLSSSSSSSTTQSASGDSGTPSQQGRVSGGSSTLQQLEELNYRICNKTQAIRALSKAQKHDAKILKLQEELQEEIVTLKTACRQLEFHVDRTQLWTDNIGCWMAHISNCQFDADANDPLFLVVVHLPAGVGENDLVGGDETQGWVISRKLSDFNQLHKRLAEIQPCMKDVSMPQVARSQKKTSDSSFLSDTKNTLNEYLMIILTDETLLHSEVVFIFFSPSPEHLKQSTSLDSKKPKFSLARLLQKRSSNSEDDTDDNEQLIFGDNDRDIGCSVSVEPLYQLIAELYELSGVFNWLRRTLMISVQTTFGRSINRHLQETINWTFSQPMLVYYVHLIRDTCWPNGELAATATARSDAQKIRMRLMTKEKCLRNIPDLLKTLVGDANARRGTIKVFEALQDARLNQHLFYVLAEKVLYEAFPELQYTQYTQQTHN